MSILIPCYNREKFLGEAIESALQQRYRPIEVVVVDDGSRDGSVRVAQSFGGNIRVEVAGHRGACAARNRALELSKGEYVQFLDSDDILLPDKIERQAEVLRCDVADMVTCGFAWFGNLSWHRQEAYPDPRGNDPFLYLLEHKFGTGIPLHRRRFLERMGGFNARLSRYQDLDLHLRLAAEGVRLFHIQESMMRKRVHTEPCISDSKVPEGLALEVMMGIVQYFGLRGVMLTDDRRRALARDLMSRSQSAFRGGERKLALEGFSMSRALDPAVSSQGSVAYRLLAKTIGPSMAEHLRSLIVGQ